MFNQANYQNNLEYIADQLQMGKITAEEANVELVRAARYRVVYRLPRQIRNWLNKAVKEKKIAHKKKEGLRPEIYYHPNFEHLANAELARIEEQSRKNINKVLTVYGDIQI